MQYEHRCSTENFLKAHFLISILINSPNLGSLCTIQIWAFLKQILRCWCFYAMRTKFHRNFSIQKYRPRCSSSATKGKIQKKKNFFLLHELWATDFRSLGFFETREKFSLLYHLSIQIVTLQFVCFTKVRRTSSVSNLRVHIGKEKVV